MDLAAYRRHDPARFAASLGARRRGYVPLRWVALSASDGGLRRRDESLCGVLQGSKLLDGCVLCAACARLCWPALCCLALKELVGEAGHRVSALCSFKSSFFSHCCGSSKPPHSAALLIRTAPPSPLNEGACSPPRRTATPWASRAPRATLAPPLCARSAARGSSAGAAGSRRSVGGRGTAAPRPRTSGRRRSRCRVAGGGAGWSSPASTSCPWL